MIDNASPDATARRARAKPVEAAFRRQEYLRRRCRGETYEEIASQMGVSPSTVRRVVKRQLERLAADARDSAQDLLQLELTKLDELERQLWPQVREGYLGAIDRLLKVSERRSRLLGLDAASRHKHEVTFESPAEQLGIDLDDVQRIHEAWLNSFGPHSDPATIDQSAGAGPPGLPAARMGVD